MLCGYYHGAYLLENIDCRIVHDVSSEKLKQWLAG